MLTPCSFSLVRLLGFSVLLRGRGREGAGANSPLTAVMTCKALQILRFPPLHFAEQVVFSQLDPKNQTSALPRGAVSGRPAVIFTSCCGVWLLPLSRLLLSLSFRQQGLCLCSFCCCGGLFPVSSPCLSQPGSLTHSQRGPVRQGCSYDEGSLCSWLCPSISFFLGLIAPYLNP